MEKKNEMRLEASYKTGQEKDPKEGQEKDGHQRCVPSPSGRARRSVATKPDFGIKIMRQTVAEFCGPDPPQSIAQMRDTGLFSARLLSRIIIRHPGGYGY